MTADAAEDVELGQELHSDALCGDQEMDSVGRRKCLSG